MSFYLNVRVEGVTCNFIIKATNYPIVHKCLKSIRLMKRIDNNTESYQKVISTSKVDRLT